MGKDRNWLEQYRKNFRGDNTLYKNYQNQNQWQLPGLKNQAIEQGVMEGIPQGYNEVYNKLPAEFRGLMPAEMMAQLRKRYEYNHQEEIEKLNQDEKDRINYARDQYEKEYNRRNDEFKASHEGLNPEQWDWQRNGGKERAAARKSAYFTPPYQAPIKLQPSVATYSPPVPSYTSSQQNALPQKISSLNFLNFYRT